MGFVRMCKHRMEGEGKGEARVAHPVLAQLEVRSKEHGKVGGKTATSHPPFSSDVSASAREGGKGGGGRKIGDLHLAKGGKKRGREGKKGKPTTPLHRTD